jgi:hypothetical protein
LEEGARLAFALGPEIRLVALCLIFMVCPRTRASVRRPTYNQWEMNKALLKAFYLFIGLDLFLQVSS